MTTSFDPTNTGDSNNDTQNMDAVTRALTNERNGYSSFSHDYTPSPETVEKVYAVLDYIKANPEKWNQDNYGNHVSGTNCFMGIGARLNGVTTERDSWMDKWYPEDGPHFHTYLIHNGMDALGLNAQGENGDSLYEDRANYVALFTDVPTNYSGVFSRGYRKPTFDELVERVSIAFNHDFRDRYKAPVSFEDALSQAFYDSVQDELHGPENNADTENN